MKGRFPMMHKTIENVTSSDVDLLDVSQHIVTFPKGIIGFESSQHFIIHDYGDDMFKMLCAINDDEIRFLMYQLPWDFYPAKDLSEALAREQIESIEDDIYVIVCMHENSMTMNIRAPLVRHNQKMWQIVMGRDYTMEYNLDDLLNTL